MIDARAGESRKKPRRDLSRILGCGLLALVCVGAKGCPVGNFRISSEPRLPRFIPIPPGRTAEDLAVTVDVYSSGQAEIIARDRRNGDVVIFAGTGTFSTKVMPCDGTRPETGFLNVRIFGEAVVDCEPDNTLVYMGVSEVLRGRRYDNVLYVVDE